MIIIDIIITLYIMPWSDIDTIIHSVKWLGRCVATYFWAWRYWIISSIFGSVADRAIIWRSNDWTSWRKRSLFNTISSKYPLFGSPIIWASSTMIVLYFCIDFVFIRWLIILLAFSIVQITICSRLWFPPYYLIDWIILTLLP